MAYIVSAPRRSVVQWEDEHMHDVYDERGEDDSEHQLVLVRVYHHPLSVLLLRHGGSLFGADGQQVLHGRGLGHAVGAPLVLHALLGVESALQAAGAGAGAGAVAAQTIGLICGRCQAGRVGQV